MKNIHVDVIQKKQHNVLNGFEGEVLLQILQRNDIKLPTNCNGIAECGACKVRIIGADEFTDKEKRILTEEERHAEIHLACEYKMDRDIQVYIYQEENDFAILQDYSFYRQAEETNLFENQREKYHIVIDLGTTTIVTMLIDCEQNCLATSVEVNDQRIYGSDIISRMNEVSRNQIDLTNIIRTQLSRTIKEVIHKAKCVESNCEKIYIAGNTIMQHLLLGYCIETLKSHPFQPVNKDMVVLPANILFSQFPCEVVIFPVISAFVGGDIVAGLYSLTSNLEYSLFLDLGTNGEMVLTNGKQSVATATAAGPAFEGGNISCGAGSVTGAICKVRIGEQGKLFIQRIGDKEEGDINVEAVGICGSGLLDLCACLLELGIMDETGLLCETYFESGFEVANNVILTQSDVRSLQLAKGAIRAGIEILINKLGISAKDVKQVFLAGGFGYALNSWSAVRIGLLPEELEQRVIPIGNSCLAGLIKYAKEEQCNELYRICKHTKEINLALEADFAEEYMNQINFPNIKNAPEGI